MLAFSASEVDECMSWTFHPAV